MFWVDLSLSHFETLLWGWNRGQPEQWIRCFHSSALGRAQKVYIFTPRFLSAEPGSALDLPSHFLASSFPLMGLSKLPGMFWILSAPVPKGVRDLREATPKGLFLGLGSAEPLFCWLQSVHTWLSMCNRLVRKHLWEQTGNPVCGCVWIPKEAEASFPGHAHGTKRQGRHFLKAREGHLAAPADEGPETGTGQGGVGLYNFHSRNAKCTDWHPHKRTPGPGGGGAPGEEAPLQVMLPPKPHQHT